MRLHVHHTTTYRYEANVAHSTQYLRLTPHDSARQRIIDWRLRLPTRASRTIDPFGNVMHVVTVDFPHRDLVIEVEGEVEVDDCAHEEAGELPPAVFLRPSTLGAADAAMRGFAHAQDDQGSPSANAWHLMERLRGHMRFLTGSTEAWTTAAEAFAAAQGVCQDFTHVYTGCARELGIPARYVSGYLLTDSDEHVASHAWAEVFVDGRWWGIDVANGIPAGARHLKLAVGMDYLDACPVRGMRRGGGAEVLEANAWVRSAEQ